MDNNNNNPQGGNGDKNNNRRGGARILITLIFAAIITLIAISSIRSAIDNVKYKETSYTEFYNSVNSAVFLRLIMNLTRLHISSEVMRNTISISTHLRQMRQMEQLRVHLIQRTHLRLQHLP